MISIIISSYQNDYFIDLEFNIQDTIGDNFEYEIIKIYNPNIYSISEAYNLGVNKSKYDYLLFIHEDTLFVTNNWGEILIQHLKNNKIGVVGVAGNTYLPNAPLGWSGLYECNHLNLIQSNKSKVLIKEFSIDNDVFAKSLDGVFLACRKDVAIKYRFEERLGGFHCYDFIFTNRVSGDYKNLISSKIKIIHFSRGNRNFEWMESLIKSRKFYIIKNQKNSFVLELKAYYYYVLRLKEYRYSKSFIFKEMLKYYSFRDLNFIGFMVFIFIGFKTVFKKY